MDEDKAGKADTDTISILDIFAVIVRRRWLIIGVTVAVAILTVGFLLYTIKASAAGGDRWNPMPDIYKPTAKVLISSGSQGSSLSSILGQSGLGALSGLIGLGGSATGTSADLAQALLMDSNVIKDAISSEFDFITRYKVTKNPKTVTRRMIQGALDIKFTSASGIMEIGYKDTDPVFATTIVNRIVELLESQFKKLTLDKVMRKKQYLEETIVEVEKQSDDITQKLVSFMSKYGILDASGSFDVGAGSSQGLPSSVRQIAQLQTQLFTKQVELRLQSDYLPQSDPRITQLKSEVAQLQKMIADLQAGSKEYSTGGIATQQLPEVSVQYLTLKRDTEIAQSILATLKQQYETAKLEETDSSQTFQIIDKAEVPEVKFGPARSKTAIIATASAFFLSVMVAFIVEYFERVRRDPVEAEKLSAIRRMLAFRKKDTRV